jgi:predicted amidohydrolase YtcJ
MSDGPTTAPEAILFGAEIYVDGDGSDAWAEALAITGGTITGIGTAASVKDLAGSSTRLIDLEGATVFPGFVDAHVHPAMGGAELLECDLSEFVTESDYVRVIAAYVDGREQDDWVFGGGWSMSAFDRGLPRSSALDSATGDHPAFFYNRDHHTAWVNSVALRAAGITAATPDPVGGRIERDPHGEPTGALHESAMDLVKTLFPPPAPDHHLESLRAGVRHLNSLGVTGWQDAKVLTREGEVEAYLELQRAGELTARVVGACYLDPERGPEQVDEFITARANTPPGLFTLSSVKIMLDGVCETHTAALSSPYLDGHGHETDNSGIHFFERDFLLDCARRLDAAGFQLHFHAVGDAAVTEALDVVEYVRSENGPGRNRHHIAHVQVVHPRDINRFRILGVSANAQPLWARLEAQMTQLTLPYLGESRGTWQYPFGDFENSGAGLVFGSDWPVSTADPIRQLHVAVNRAPAPDRTSWQPADGAFLPDQRMSLPSALRAFTRGSAWINHHEHVSGVIREGFSADLAVLDSNPFARPTADIWRSNVIQTWFRGEPVFTADPA